MRGFDPRVEAEIAAAARNRRIDVKDGELDYGAGTGIVTGAEMDLTDVDWPTVPHYGYEHGRDASTLAMHIAKILGVTRPLDLDALRLAGMMHDICRVAPWERWALGAEADPNPGRRSAEFVERYMQKRNQPTELIERTVRLIIDHTLSAAELPRDPLLMALWDADALESARFAPGTSQGHNVWRARTSRLCVDWSKQKDTKAIWMRYGGWRL